MKANTATDTNVTPSKKLKQARLPFKLISPTTSSPDAPVTRKRKLSSNENDSICKKLSKENNTSTLSDTIVISDDEKSNSGDHLMKKEEILLNPLLKIVENARKKRLKKAKAKKNKDDKNTDSSLSVEENANETEIVNIINKNNKNNDEPIDTMDVEDQKSIVSQNSNSDLKNKTSLKSPSEASNNSKQTTPDSVKSALPNDKSNTSLQYELDKDLSFSEQDSQEKINTSVDSRELKIRPESAKKKELRLKEKQEREIKRSQEKEERARMRQEKEDQKKKEREEKEEQKRKEKEEKEKQREMEKKLRDEKEEQKRKEKEEKEEQKRKEREEKEEQKRKEKEDKEEQKRKEKEAKEDEKKKKQEALDQEKQEQELKKKKAAEAFVNFFVPKQKTEKERLVTITMSQNSLLSSFTLKSDMRLAPLVRCNLDKAQKMKLEDLILAQKERHLYLKCLKNNSVKPGSSGKTWPLNDKNDADVIIVEDELSPLDGVSECISCESAIREKLRPKLISFHDNRRPPYWGTWRKKSAYIKPKTPFGRDKKLLDYEVDSDEEWEEEEGESIDGSKAGSDDDTDGDEYDVDNEFLVPHGYLSDEEATMDEDDVLSLSPEAQKAKLKHLEAEFEIELKKPTEKLKPRIYGILWESNDGNKPDKCVDALWDYFNKLAMIMEDPTALLQPAKESEETEKKKTRRKKSQVEGEESSPKIEKKKRQKPEIKEHNKSKVENKKMETIAKKNQPGINSFLKKLKSP